MRRAAYLLSALLGVMALAPEHAVAQSLPDWHTPEGARQLVRLAVTNELKQERAAHRFMFRLATQKPGLLQVKENVETDDGVVARLVSQNGQALTAEQRVAENARLQKLLTDRQGWAKRRKEQQDDEVRTRRMLQVLPDAFLFQYEGTETAAGGEMVRLRFSPDPAFTPPSREAQVFQGMQGEMWVETGELHVVRVDGTLFKGVNFGWGMLGHLDKGGHFLVEQSHLDPDRWEVTHMQLDFTGKALLFLKLNIHEDETASDFRPVPGHLSLQQGIELLERPAAAGMAGLAPGKGNQH